MKRYRKIVNIIIITIICILMCSSINYVYGSSFQQEALLQDGGGTSKPQEDQITEDTSKKVIDTDFYKPTDTAGNNTQFINMGNIIIGIMRVVGTVIAVVALMVIGLRYMFGSTAEKATYKETMIPYLIGAIMLFTIPNVLGILYELVKGINM